jgi:hypothetical protein
MAFCIPPVKNDFTAISRDNIQQIINQFQNDSDVFFSLIDMNTCNHINDFYKQIEENFCVPSYLPILNISCLADRTRMLNWLKHYKPIIMVILDLSKMRLKDQPRIITCFRDYVLPYWEGNPGTLSVVDQGEDSRPPRKFDIYYT